MRLLLLFSFSLTALLTAEEPQSITYQRMITSLNDAVVASPKQDTDIKNDLAMDRVIASARDLIDKKTISLNCPIENVSSKSDGVVKLRLGHPSDPKLPPDQLSMVWTTDFLVSMPADKAAAIKKGDIATVTCVLEFVPRKWGAVGGPANHTQQLWTFRHRDLTFIGTVITSVFFDLGGRRPV